MEANPFYIFAKFANSNFICLTYTVFFKETSVLSGHQLSHLVSYATINFNSLLPCGRAAPSERHLLHNDMCKENLNRCRQWSSLTVLHNDMDSFKFD